MMGALRGVQVPPHTAFCFTGNTKLKTELLSAWPDAIEAAKTTAMIAIQQVEQSKARLKHIIFSDHSDGVKQFADAPNTPPQGMPIKAAQWREQG
jgi:hypothetical protein